VAREQHVTQNSASNYFRYLSTRSVFYQTYHCVATAAAGEIVMGGCLAAGSNNRRITSRLTRLTRTLLMLRVLAHFVERLNDRIFMA